MIRVFQEVTLAPRILYCGSDEYYWECRSVSIGESQKRGNRSNMRSGFEYFNSDGFSQTMWHRMIERYSSLDFTFENDRIAALAGITSWIRNTSGLHPVLGCWRECFVKDLAWMIFSAPRKSARSSKTLKSLPSWSWLSVASGGISFLNLERSVECLSILDLNARWARQELCTELASSRLLVRGLVFEIPWKKGPQGDLIPLKQFHNVTHTAGYALDGDAEPDGEKIVSKSHRTCLLLTCSTIPSMWGPGGEKTIQLEFLVVKALSQNKDVASRSYRRVGCGFWKIVQPAAWDREPRSAFSPLGSIWAKISGRDRWWEAFTSLYDVIYYDDDRKITFLETLLDTTQTDIELV
jgi:hypothetical protein